MMLTTRPMLFRNAFCAGSRALLLSPSPSPSLRDLSRNFASGPAVTPNKPFTLYTFGTPNGRKASVYLEELKDSYPSVDYECVSFSFDCYKCLIRY